MTQSSSSTRPTTVAPVAETPVDVPVDTAAPTEETAVVKTKDQVEVAPERAVVVTPPQSVGPVGRVAVPVLGVMTLASALAALELTKRPRRSLGSGTPSQEGL